MGELARAAEARLRPFLIEQTRDGLAILSTNIGGEERGGGEGVGGRELERTGPRRGGQEEATPRRFIKTFTFRQHRILKNVVIREPR